MEQPSKHVESRHFLERMQHQLCTKRAFSTHKLTLAKLPQSLNFAVVKTALLNFCMCIYQKTTTFQLALHSENIYHDPPQTFNSLRGNQNMH